MMSNSLKHTFVFLLGLFTIISCKKDDPQKKDTTENGQISYFAQASGTGVKAIAKQPGSFLLNTAAVEWSSASIYVEKISFVGKSNSQLDNTTITVDKNMNIFSGNALAGIIQLPQGVYKDVKVKLYLRKSPKSELAFNLRGTFINTKGGRDSLIVASSYPFEANLGATDITINPSDNYKVTFNFDLNKVLTGISTAALQTARSYPGATIKTYVIWKGGSADEPFYDQVTANWQTVASVVVSK